MQEPLTMKQEQILGCIKKSLREKGYPPSVRELCTAVGLSSTSTVHSHLNSLEKKGYIRRDPSKPRTIEVLDEKTAWLNEQVTPVPIIGQVTAGQPILAVENIEDYFPLPHSIAKQDDLFMLHVKGTSMIEAGIYSGDKIIVRCQSTAQNGDIVVAMIEDEVTVKRFYKEKTCIRLQPENEAMAPMYFDQVTILGKVIGLFRAIK